jgi:hypothetical protein
MNKLDKVKDFCIRHKYDLIAYGTGAAIIGLTVGGVYIYTKGLADGAVITYKTIEETIKKQDPETWSKVTKIITDFGENVA